MSLFEDKETKELVRKLEDIAYKKQQEKKRKSEEDALEKNIQAIQNMYSIGRDDAKQYIKHEERVSVWDIVYVFIFVFLMSICAYELTYGPGAILRLIGLNLL